MAVFLYFVKGVFFVFSFKKGADNKILGPQIGPHVSSSPIQRGQDCPPQDCPPGSQSWGGQSWGYSTFSLCWFPWHTYMLIARAAAKTMDDQFDTDTCMQQKISANTVFLQISKELQMWLFLAENSTTSQHLSSKSDHLKPKLMNFPWKGLFPPKMVTYAVFADCCKFLVHTCF